MRTGLLAPLIVVTLVALPGCAAPNPAASAREAREAREGGGPDPERDPCAIRLHDASGALLLYFAQHRKLPPTLDVLEHVPGAEDAGDFTCPLSHQPYVYNPQGLPAPDRWPGGLLVLYDATPAHGGRRWAVVVFPPEGGGPLVAKVISIPEKQFPKSAGTGEW